jgi:hypothetical protein
VTLAVRHVVLGAGLFGLATSAILIAEIHGTLAACGDAFELANVAGASAMAAVHRACDRSADSLRFAAGLAFASLGLVWFTAVRFLWIRRTRGAGERAPQV